MLQERGISPEDLPPATDIRKVERRVEREKAEVGKHSGRLPDPEDPPKDSKIELE